jgi:hypothetical protein
MRDIPPPSARPAARSSISRPKILPERGLVPGWNQRITMTLPRFSPIATRMFSGMRTARSLSQSCMTPFRR